MNPSPPDPSGPRCAHPSPHSHGTGGHRDRQTPSRGVADASRLFRQRWPELDEASSGGSPSRGEKQKQADNIACLLTMQIPRTPALARATSIRPLTHFFPFSQDSPQFGAPSSALDNDHLVPSRMPSLIGRRRRPSASLHVMSGSGALTRSRPSAQGQSRMSPPRVPDNDGKATHTPLPRLTCWHNSNKRSRRTDAMQITVSFCMPSVGTRAGREATRPALPCWSSLGVADVTSASGSSTQRSAMTRICHAGL